VFISIRMLFDLSISIKCLTSIQNSSSFREAFVLGSNVTRCGRSFNNKTILTKKAH
jgi:hypothetical protein